MKMAYIAIDATGWCFAISSADPECIEDTAQDIKQWKNDGAEVKLLPLDEAKEIFVKSVRNEQKQNRYELMESALNVIYKWACFDLENKAINVAVALDSEAVANLCRKALGITGK